MGDRHVSIHVPREGCDYPRKNYRIYLDRFQFTHPGRGATQLVHNLSVNIHVSIHAPREGCDIALWKASRRICRFQFTHPGRGATD